MGHAIVFLEGGGGGVCLLAGFSFLLVRSFVRPWPPPSFDVDKGLG